MIHKAELPKETEQKLSYVLLLQLALFRWAAKKNDPSNINESDCITFLNRIPNYQDKAAEISSWIWSSQDRYKPLIDLADGQGPKKEWSKKLYGEAYDLLRYKSPNKYLTKVEKDTCTDWQKAGKSFLENFYSDLRDNGFPSNIFPDNKRFDGYKLLENFAEINDKMCICPACDEVQYKITSKEKVRSFIDHYFPKSLYPHLSIHPYNLVPICSYCNSFIKGTKDPLEDGFTQRKTLKNVWLPYERPALTESTYLDVSYNNDLTSAEFEIKNNNGWRARNHIKGVDVLFDIPKRYNAKSNEIGEKLFRRINRFLANSSVSTDQLFVQNVKQLLKELIARMKNDDLAREPHTYAMVWWLAKLVKEELNAEGTPFAQELKQIASQRTNTVMKLRSQGESIVNQLP